MITISKPSPGPEDPYKFAKDIESKQHTSKDCGYHKVLFNKGRYFETSIYNKEILTKVSELIQVPISYENMILGSWKKLAEFVIAMNCLNIHVEIDIDWI